MDPITPRIIIKIFKKQDSINKEFLLKLMKVDDLHVRAKIHEFITRDKFYTKINPSLELDEELAFFFNYFHDCIFQNIQNDEDVLSRYGACFEITPMFNSLMNDVEKYEKIIFAFKNFLTQIYRDGDKEIQNAIICGSLEHILESRRARKYFEDWLNDPELKPGYEAAMEWAVDHERD